MGAGDRGKGGKERGWERRWEECRSKVPISFCWLGEEEQESIPFSALTNTVPKEGQYGWLLPAQNPLQHRGTSWEAVTTHTTTGVSLPLAVTMK